MSGWVNGWIEEGRKEGRTKGGGDYNELTYETLEAEKPQDL